MFRRIELIHALGIDADGNSALVEVISLDDLDFDDEAAGMTTGA